MSKDAQYPSGVLGAALSPVSGRLGCALCRVCVFFVLESLQWRVAPCSLRGFRLSAGGSTHAPAHLEHFLPLSPGSSRPPSSRSIGLLWLSAALLLFLLLFCPYLSQVVVVREGAVQ